MNKAYFITGTDTGVGKTCLTLGLMDYFKRQHKVVAGMKPVAAGCEWRQGIWQNEDAVKIQSQSSIELPYSLINPYAFKRPVSPHVASEGETIDIKRIEENLNIIRQQADVVFVEGAGGWYSPLSETFDNCFLAETLQLPVVLVVAIRLGCINRALLTWRAIQKSKAECTGWVAMVVEPGMPAVEENISYIQASLETVPLLGVVPFQTAVKPEYIAQKIHGF